MLLTPTAAAELSRQAAFAGTPGQIYLDLLPDTCGDNWMHIRVQAGSNNGVPIVRTDGVTVFVPQSQMQLFKGLQLNYYGDLSGGGFLVSPPDGMEVCVCGSGFRPLI